MKKLLIATAALLALATPALADSHIIKVGILMGFTGPIESLTVGIARGAEIALEEANDSGELLGGKMFKAVKADTTCVDAAAATASAERLINVEGVAAIVGALCSGSTIASANNVAIPNGVVLISPASTSPAITGMVDDVLVFRVDDALPLDGRRCDQPAILVNNQGYEYRSVAHQSAARTERGVIRCDQSCAVDRKFAGENGADYFRRSRSQA